MITIYTQLAVERKTELVARIAVVCSFLWVGQGIGCAQTGQQWRDSLSVLNRRMMSSPYSSDLWLRKAAVNLELQQWNYAIETYTEVLGHDAANLAALYYRAYAHQKLRHYDLAKNDYDAFIKIAPYHLNARLGQAYILICQGKKKDAMDQYNRMAELFPDSALVYASRASLESEMKSEEMALLDWQKAVELDPDNMDYRYSMAELLIRMRRKDEARECLETMVKHGIGRGQLHDFFQKVKK